jgi:hypothetical protein
MAVLSRLETLFYTVGNVAIALTLIFLVIMTRKKVPQVRWLSQTGTS